MAIHAGCLPGIHRDPVGQGIIHYPYPLGPAETVHGGFPHKEAEEEPGGNPAVLCGGKPRGDHLS